MDEQTHSPGPLVVVVDDDPSVRRSLGRLLRSFGFRSREFAAGAELLASAELSAADCFILDVHMPEMDGYELTNRLTAVRPDAPLLLITARIEELERQGKDPSPALALLLKPFSDDQLLGAIEQALGPAALEGERI
jgi:FixJ family two-component response regulator